MKFLVKSTFGRHKGIHKIKEPKVYKAEIWYSESGEIVQSTAKKENGQWLIGGDKAAAWKGGKIFITIKNKMYWLKGNRLVFQDNVSESHPHYEKEEPKPVKPKDPLEDHHFNMHDDVDFPDPKNPEKMLTGRMLSVVKHNGKWCGSIQTVTPDPRFPSLDPEIEYHKVPLDQLRPRVKLEEI